MLFKHNSNCAGSAESFKGLLFTLLTKLKPMIWEQDQKEFRTILQDISHSLIDFQKVDLLFVPHVLSESRFFNLVEILNHLVSKYVRASNQWCCNTFYALPTTFITYVSSSTQWQLTTSVFTLFIQRARLLSLCNYVRAKSASLDIGNVRSPLHLTVELFLRPCPPLWCNFRHHSKRSLGTSGGVCSVSHTYKQSVHGNAIAIWSTSEEIAVLCVTVVRNTRDLVTLEFR